MYVCTDKTICVISINGVLDINIPVDVLYISIFNIKCIIYI